jgi:hypothetical protein
VGELAHPADILEVHVRERAEAAEPHPAHPAAAVVGE